MNAALPTLPVSPSGAAAMARAGESSAGRDGARPGIGFLDQLVQALGVPCGAQGGLAPGQATASAPPALGDPALIAAGDAQPAQPGAAPSQAAAPAPQDGPILPQAALAAVQAVALPAQPVPAQAAPKTAKDDARPAARPGERRTAAARPGTAADITAQTDARQEQQPILPALAATVLPISIPAAPAQADPAQGSQAENDVAVDGSARAGQPGVVERLPGRHGAAVAAGAEAPQAAAPEAVLPKMFTPHLIAAAQPGPDKPEAAPAAQVDALLPSAAPPGGSAATTHDEPTRSAAPTTQAQPSSPTPAAQMAPALVHIATAPGGAQHVTVRLDPVELGELRVHIERPREGPVHVTVEATRPETLQLLRQDQPALHRALDQAGLPAEGRVVVLQQASPDGGQRGSAADAGGVSADGNPGGGQGDNQGGGRGNSQGWAGSGGGEGAPGDHGPRRNAWLRAGLDITA